MIMSSSCTMHVDIHVVRSMIKTDIFGKQHHDEFNFVWKRRYVQIFEETRQGVEAEETIKTF
jgi:hypothetical protein